MAHDAHLKAWHGERGHGIGWHMVWRARRTSLVGSSKMCKVSPLGCVGQEGQDETRCREGGEGENGKTTKC